MNKQALLKGAKMLDENARNFEGVRFDLYFWGHVHNRRKKLSCSTSACAMGLFALSREFKRLKARILATGSVMIVWGKNSDPDYTTSGIAAATALFDIPRSHAEALFIGISLPNFGRGAKAERGLARGLRAYVRSGGDLAAARRAANPARYGK